MEAWSDEPLGTFRIKFFLDTNILSDIVNKTYSGLNIAVGELKKCNFVDLVSSRFVIFEFIDVRKKILYLGEVNRIKGRVKSKDPTILIRYKEHFEKSEVNFEAYKNVIKTQIESELEIIIQDLEIVCDDNLLHDSLLSPTKDINLFSKISREDSLVLVSSLWPEESIKETFVVLLTRDKPFVDSYNELDLEEIFEKYSLNSPTVEHIESMQLNGSYHLNLTESSQDGHIPEYLLSKIKELIIKKNQTCFLGKTIPPGKSDKFPTDVVCFRLNENTDLNNNLYLTIIGKDLDFIYSTKLPIQNFYDQVPITSYPLNKTIPTNISFRPTEDIDGTPTPLPADVVSRLRETGNLVFINPDGA